MSDSFMNKKFYVYMYSDPETRLPIYVGKGSGGRYKKHLNGSHNPYLNNKVAKIRTKGLEPIVEKFYFTDDEQKAYDVEEHYIKLFGVCENGGILCNFLLGGENGKTREFPAEFYESLGKYSDRLISEKFETSVSTVRRARVEKGVSARRKMDDGVVRNVVSKPPHNKITLTTEQTALIGTVSDKDLSEIVGCTPSCITKKRKSMGIPSCNVDWRTLSRDNSTYLFRKVGTEESVRMTRSDFMTFTKSSSGHVSGLITGKNKTVKGWEVVND